MKNSICRHHARFFDTAIDYMCVISKEQTITMVNPAFSVLGYSHHELLSNPLDVFIHPEDWLRTQLALTELVDGRALVGLESRFRHKEGAWTWLAWNGQPPSSDGFLYLIGRDVTEQIEHRAELTLLAHKDALTGLANLSSFCGEVSRSIARAQRAPMPLAILFIDLDDFKPINDRFGHQAGNRLLQEVATRLVSSVRLTDLVARVGGDEFAVLMCGTPLQPDVLATRILEALSMPFTVDGTPFSLGSSIGIAVTNLADQITSDQLVQLADHEMYKAKRSGGNRFSLISV